MVLEKQSTVQFALIAPVQVTIVTTEHKYKLKTARVTFCTILWILQTADIDTVQQIQKVSINDLLYLLICIK